MAVVVVAVAVEVALRRGDAVVRESSQSARQAVTQLTNLQAD